MSLSDTIAGLGTSLISLINKRVAEGDDGINVANYGAIADANYYNADDGKWYTSSAKTTEATDNYTAIAAAVADAKAQKKFLVIKGKYRSSQDIVIDGMKGVIGDGGIVGCTCAFSRCQPFKTEGFLYFDRLMICGSYRSLYDKLYSYGDIIFKGNGYENQSYGFFWNKFNSIDCKGKMLFDMDGGHSINQNVFENIRAAGGLHIKGTSTTGGKVSCNSNTFINIDTSGANIIASDGTSGYQILNESYANQCNHIINWYSETGKCRIKGKWNILGNVHIPSVDLAELGSLLTDRQNHVLFNGPDNTKQIGDFIAASPVNRFIGGGWKYLGKDGCPLDIFGNNTVREVIGVDDAPDGNPLAMRIRNEVHAGYANIGFRLPLTSSEKVVMTAFIKINYAPDLYLNTRRNAAGNPSYGTKNLVPVGNNWYLLRTTGQVCPISDRQNMFDGKYLNDGSLTRNEEIALNNNFGFIFNFTMNFARETVLDTPDIILGSIFFSTEKATFLPQFELGPKEARSNEIPTGGIWKIGDKCFNSVPTVGQPYGWVCTTSGDCRTLSGVTGSIETDTTTLTVNDPSLLYTGANIAIAGVTGNKLITNISENTITIDSNADATVTDAVISFVSPVWASMGNLE